MVNDHPANSLSQEATDDQVARFVLSGGTVKGAVIRGSQLVAALRATHGLGVLETLVLGHATLGAALMCTTLKGRDRMALKIDCSGPIKGLAVEGDSGLNLRGYLKAVPIPVDAPLASHNLAPFFGAGFLSVTRILEGGRRPFEGRVAIEHGNLAQDLAHYYATSEQTPTAFVLSIAFDAKGKVNGAGGLFLQAMPDAADGNLAQVEAAVRQQASLGAAFSEPASCRRVILNAFAGFDPRLLDTQPVQYRCHCSRERSRRLLALLPSDDLRDLAVNGPFPITLDCRYCGQAYAFDRSDMAALLRRSETREA
jgi:molecular chaperone Hsp33